MHSKQQFPSLRFGASLRVQNATLAIMLTLGFLIFLTLIAQPAQGQTFNVIYSFTGAADGAWPNAGLTMDRAGNLYGTTMGWSQRSCERHLCGTVFELSRGGSGWVLNTLYSFQGLGLTGVARADGASPRGRVAIADDGTLYGTTYFGGIPTTCVYLYWDDGCGTVFQLTPPAGGKSAAPWDETVLYRFRGARDGGSPQGDLTFDRSGNIYGTTLQGGYNPGVVYKLAPSGRGWEETVIYYGSADQGITPSGGVIFDQSGNLYGVMSGGGIECDDGAYCGSVYKLSPSGSGWTEQTLYLFTRQSGGTNPIGGLVLDGAGNLYGTTPGWLFCCGTVFELTPTDGTWIYNTIRNGFSGVNGGGRSTSSVWIQPVTSMAPPRVRAPMGTVTFSS